MKRGVIIALFAIFCTMALSAQFRNADGFYFAQDASFRNNQKNQVVLEIRGGRIVSANWNVLSLEAGERDYKTLAAAGSLPAAVTWAAQAKAAEDTLVSSQNANAAVPNVPAATVKPFFDLVKTATGNRAAAVSRGNYKDGWYFAADEASDNYDTKNTVLITVVNGSIVDVLWNGILDAQHAKPSPSKIITSMSDRNRGYPMTGAKSPWHIQAGLVGAELVRVQNPDSIRTNAFNIPDSISGASIGVANFLALSRQALQSAR